ncbi:MAG TPA: bifunctional uridylyltransferase/uridylyl-removing protein, partial [Magnetovibrio sp.]
MRLKIKKPRDVINRKDLAARLDAAASSGGDLTKPNARGPVLALFKGALEDGRREVQRRFEEREAVGSATMHSGAYLLDQLIRTLHEFTTIRVFPQIAGDHVALIATGGYGRAEIAPQSDLDVMFLLHHKAGKELNQAVEWMLYMLWDMGLKVGHATRTVSEAVELAKTDVTICTSLLEARWISGDHELFKALEQRFERDVIQGSEAQFVKAKLEERDARHERMGDSRYVLEPNIKDGKGGLRDLQTLFWIARYIYRVKDVAGLIEKGVLDKTDARRFSKAQRFLWTLRCHLHYLAGRPEETLGFNVQSDLAERMGYTDHAGALGVERFMKHYFLVARDVGDLTRVICAVLEHQHAKRSRLTLPSFNFRKKRVPGFIVEAGRLTVEDAEVFKKDPVNL